MTDDGEGDAILLEKGEADNVTITSSEASDMTQNPSSQMLIDGGDFREFLISCTGNVTVQ